MLIKLLDREKPEIVLPIHDSFIVRMGREDLLFQTMREAFRDVVGVDAVIDTDKTIHDPPDGYEGNELDYMMSVLSQEFDEDVAYAGYSDRNEQWRQTFGSIDNSMNNIDILLERTEALVKKYGVLQQIDY